jgi:hypothetical protein
MKKYIFSAIACLLIINVFAQSIQNDKNNDALRKIQLAVMAVKNLYVDTVNTEKLVEDGIRGMLNELDPHSAYTTAKETKAFTEQLQGSFEGIGVQFNISNDTLIVVQPVNNGPSEKVGIMAGDRIVLVNDTVISGVKMTREAIVKRLRGPKGSKVKLGIQRRGIKDRLTFVVTRDKIPLTTVDVAYMIRPQVGYVRVESFGETTYDELMVALEKLKQQGMTKLILDLQDNGGGYLKSAADIANEFLTRGSLIVYTQGRRVPKQEYTAHGNGKYQDLPLYILINEYSASAAEIVSGAMQDHDRGTIIGRRSFGKGLVQRPFEFEDGSMMRITIAHYYTPVGRNIQKPYEKGDKEGYEMDIEKRFKHGELYHKDSIHFADSLKFQTLRLKRTVYGGGGIMPDEFVPLDTTRTTPFYRQLWGKSIVLNAAFKYNDSQRKKLRKRYPTFEQFKAGFVVPEDVLKGIVDEAKKDKITYKDEKEWQRTIPMLQLQLKSLIARDLWGMSECYQILNENNPIVLKAIELAK